MPNPSSAFLTFHEQHMYLLGKGVPKSKPPRQDILWSCGVAKSLFQATASAQLQHSFNGQLETTRTTTYRQSQTIQIHWMNAVLSQDLNCLPWEDENQMKLLRFLAGGTIFLTSNGCGEFEYVFLKYNKGTQLILESQYQFLKFHWDTINNALQAY